jgi:UDP-N-acetylmuramate: L-alanyl-gamma-D-glutamyl-meso-diaminopimelate ligase
MQHVHFIAIGKTVILDLAIAVNKKHDYKVTVSGDYFPDYTLKRLKEFGLAPDRLGWFPDEITRQISVIVYGSEVHPDNPELKRARELGIKVYSSPEYLYIQTRNKTRIVVAGSYGKTTITAMILYVMRELKVGADYLIGAHMDGFDTTVHLSFESRIAVFDGDETLSSEIDQRPRFHHYKPHIAVLTGLANEMNTTDIDYSKYIEQFNQFIELVETQGRLIYYEGDPTLEKLTTNLRRDLVAFPYNLPAFELIDGIYYLKTRKGKTALKIKRERELRCIQAALLACKQVGINEDQFLSAIGGFSTNMIKKQD